MGQIFEFSLTFEAIPSSTRMIDIIEDASSSSAFNFYGVNLSASPSNNTGTPSTTARPNYTEVATTNQDCDKINITPASRKPDFNTFLSGVRGAVIWVNASRAIQGHAPAFDALGDYLTAMGFETVVQINADNTNEIVSVQNWCEKVAVEILFGGYNLNNGEFSNIRMVFTYFTVSASSGSFQWEFSTRKTARSQAQIVSVLREMYGSRKPAFNRSNMIQPIKRKTCWTEANYRSHVTSNGCDAIEGIYQKAAGNGNNYRVAVRKMNGNYHLIYLSGSIIPCEWDEGEIKAYLQPTATPLLFNAKWIMAYKSENNNCFISFEPGLMNVILDGEKDIYVKLFPSATDNFGSSSSETAGSGTGWAISSNGYIVTNHHVTEGAKSIKVRGINGDFSKTFNARVVVEDRNNDLAVIKIEDTNFTSLGTIPYTISTQGVDVGTSVFVLGYPLRSTMGDEVKLTNGIISSSSGFQGDITSYQVSAPIQPGNSGAPLFDGRGNVIGVINAKHVGAENVSYGVKASYLVNLINMISSPPRLQTVNTLTGKPLTEQVRIAQRFVYIIEVND